MNSDCEKIKDQIADLVTGILPEAQTQIMEQHLNECAACRDYARALKDEDMLLTEFFAKIDTDMTNRQERVLQTVNRSCLSKQTDTLSIRRTIMKSPITKLAVAAVVIAVVVLGLFEFIGTEGKSGVVWAEVAGKVEASRGVIYRQRATCTKYEYPNGPGYSIIYISPTHNRSDGYNGGQLTRSMYCDMEARTRVVVLHDRKGYVRETLPERDAQQHPGWDPKNWVQKFLSCEYRKLGEKTINGVLCEGTETTDPTLVGEGAKYFQIDSLVARLWVSVEMGYPVLVESEFTGQYSGENVIDQFQWDVELDASVFEPNIPPDYEQM